LQQQVPDSTRTGTKKRKNQGTAVGTSTSTGTGTGTEGDLPLPQLQYYTTTEPTRDHGKTETLQSYRDSYTSTKSTVGRIKILISIDGYLESTYPSGKQSNLKELARNFYQRNVCLQSCYSGEVDAFVRYCTGTTEDKLFRGCAYECKKCGTTSTAAKTKKQKTGGAVTTTMSTADN
jgi:hypothetical protein